MKNIRKILSFILALMLLFSMAACASGGVADAPMGYEEFAAIVATPKDAAFEKLQLSGAEITGDRRDYLETGKTKTIFGTDFEVQVMLYDTDDVTRLTNVRYFIILDDTKKAAETISAIAAEFTKKYGTAKHNVSEEDPMNFADMTVADLEKFLIPEASDFDLWVLGQKYSEDTKAYVECIKGNPPIEPDPSAPVTLTARLLVTVPQNAEKVLIWLDYRMEFMTNSYV